MNEDDVLDISKLGELEFELLIKLINFSSSQEFSKEMCAALVVALGDLMVMTLTAMVGEEKAVDYAALIISRGFKTTHALKEAIEEKVKKGEI